MNIRGLRARGQSFTELAILLALVMAALVGMRTYMQRGIQARLKTSTDDLLRIADDDTTGRATQAKSFPRAYEETSAEYATTSQVNEQAVEQRDQGAVGRTSTYDRSNARTGTERYMELE